MSLRGTVLLVLAALVVTACGTRVPDERFDALIANGAASAGPTGSAGPVAGGGGPADAPSGADNADGGDLSGLGPVDDGAAGSLNAGGTAGESGAATGSNPNTSGGTSGNDGSNDAPGSGTGGGGTTSGAQGPGGGATGAPGDPNGAAEPNQASDVGVTETSIKVGNIVSMGGPLGDLAFGPSYWGANAYFAYLNQVKGGVHGRTVDFVTCKDKEDPSANQACVDQMINQEKVFALVANATRAYAGAEDVANAGFPDVMGQPIGNPYWTYPGFYAIRGSEYAQDGTTVGYKGKIYGGLVAFRWMQQHLDLKKSAVFYYSVPASKQFGQHIADALRKVGLDVVEYEINAALPNFESRVADMRNGGVDNIWDTMDVNGNRNLCAAMDRNDFQVKAKMTTSQGMGRGIRSYSSPCRQSIYSVAEALPYSETSNSEVALFQEVMSKLYDQDVNDNLAQWAWEGWLAAKSFTEAVASMGAAPTRKGLTDYYDNLRDYTLGGLFSPLEWVYVDFDNVDTREECVIISHWNEDVHDFERVSENPHCEQTEYESYEAV